MGRAPCCEKVGMKKGRWTAEEDELLAKYIQAHGEGSWRSLPKNAGLLRCGKSCRLRWINYLRGDLKRGNISTEEENTIVKLHASFGNRWSLIASHLPGRTDNEIKNYWNSHLSRKIYSFPKVACTEETLPPKVAPPVPIKRKGGRTSRWAMKKNKTYTQKTKQTIQVPVPVPVPVPAPLTPSLGSEITSHPIEEEVVTRTVSEADDDDDMLLGLCDELEGGGINSGSLSLSDMLDSYCLAETCGASTLSEEREDDVVVGSAVRGENECPQQTLPLNEDPENSVDVTSSSMSFDFDDNNNWDWESVIEFNNIFESEWEHNENQLLTWLWEDDDWESDCKKLEETNSQIQNDMLVAWFLS
ncbi:hypothetical protein RJT34_23223 [Clitoria ternatea]|uniref:Uncharacterized protein n=1 Tax=Clitoria ternatea TaxID=43366 RepID=A0AAN9IER4_CLITE